MPHYTSQLPQPETLHIFTETGNNIDLSNLIRNEYDNGYLDTFEGITLISDKDLDTPLRIWLEIGGCQYDLPNVTITAGENVISVPRLFVHLALYHQFYFCFDRTDLTSKVTMGQFPCGVFGEYAKNPLLDIQNEEMIIMYASGLCGVTQGKELCDHLLNNFNDGQYKSTNYAVAV